MWFVLQISSAHPFGPYQKRMHSDVVPLDFQIWIFKSRDFQCRIIWQSFNSYSSVKSSER